MAEFPFLPFWTDAHLADTLDLSNEEHGCYVRLLMYAWRTPDCRLPDDDRRLARMVGETPKKWVRLRVVMLRFFVVRDGFWEQKRLSKERAFVDSRSNKLSANAKARWADKALENNDFSDADASAGLMQDGMQKSMPGTSTHTYSQTHEGGGGAPPPPSKAGRDGPSPTLRDAILEAIGVDPVSGLTGPNGRMLGTSADMERARGWIDALGLTHDEVIAVVREVMATKPDGPPSSFRYFTAAMSRLAATKQAAPPHPAASGHFNGQASAQRSMIRDAVQEAIRRSISKGSKNA